MNHCKTVFVKTAIQRGNMIMSSYKQLALNKRKTMFLMHSNTYLTDFNRSTIGRTTSTVSRELRPLFK